MKLEMKAVEVNNSNAGGFISYCRKYAKEQDESYIPREDYSVRDDEPAYVLLDENGTCAGAASLMLHPQFREIKKGRFRIFHCIEKSFENYKLLLDPVLKHSSGIENIYCFITDDKEDVREIWKKLGFKIKRYSWVLDREIDGTVPLEFPDGFEVKKMTAGTDEDAWCEIINSAFRDIEGHMHMLPEMIDEMRKEEDYMDGGMNILWSWNKPAGLVKLIKLNDESGIEKLFIETIAVHPDYQGRGLGRMMLRYGINFGKEMGLTRTELTVNSENEDATRLYFKEGFKKSVVFICYNKKL